MEFYSGHCKFVSLFKCHTICVKRNNTFYIYTNELLTEIKLDLDLVSDINSMHLLAMSSGVLHNITPAKMDVVYLGWQR